MKKVLYIILAAIIIIGTILIATVGFNVDIIYSKHKEAIVNLGKEYNLEEVKQIIKEEVKDKKVKINKVEKFNDTFIIKAKNISDEEKENLTKKLQEKYEIEDTTNIIKVNTVGKLRLRDLAKPYIMPISILTILILVYKAIVYRKLGSAKVAIKELIFLIIAIALYLSIIAIVRLPVNRLFVPGGLAVYLLTMILTNIQFFNKLKQIKQKEKNVEKI